MYSRFLKVEGDSFNKGQQIGLYLKDRIEANYVNQKRHYEVMGYNFDLWAKECEKYIPIMKEHTPNTFQEIEGMAKGSGIALNNILALTTAYEKSFGCENVNDKCTYFSAFGDATEGGVSICGQTNDERMDEFPPELDLTIHHKSETGHEILIYTHPGIPAYMGMNNKGISINWTYIDNGKREHGVPTNAIIREILEFSEYEEAVKYLQSIPHAIPNFFALGHKEKGSVGLECFPNKVYTENYCDVGYHANHNIFSPCEADTTKAYSTQQRYARIESLVKGNFGKINLEKAMDFFKDHENFPYSICTHPNNVRPVSKTLAAMVFDLDNGSMYISHSTPCETPYNKYKFDTYCV